MVRRLTVSLVCIPVRSGESLDALPERLQAFTVTPALLETLDYRPDQREEAEYLSLIHI